jgi:hypothetical protein
MLPSSLDAAVCEPENLGFAEVEEPAPGIPLAHITPVGRAHRASTSKEISP